MISISPILTSRFCSIANSGILCRYLHEACSPSLVHKNIKSENILLDADLNPHLSDSGLANLMADVDQVMLCVLPSSKVFCGIVLKNVIMHMQLSFTLDKIGITKVIYQGVNLMF